MRRELIRDHVDEVIIADSTLSFRPKGGRLNWDVMRGIKCGVLEINQESNFANIRYRANMTMYPFLIFLAFALFGSVWIKQWMILPFFIGIGLVNYVILKERHETVIRDLIAMNLKRNEEN